MNEQPFNRSDSTSSQEYLTEPCKKRGFNWRSCWAKFGNLASISLIVVNVFLVFILFPLISSCISRLDKIVENQNEFQNALVKRVDGLDKSNKQINKAIQDAEMKESKPGPKGDKGVTGT